MFLCLWPKRDEVTGGGRDCVMRSFMICTFGWSNQEERDGRGMWHYGGEELLGWRSLKERDHLSKTGVDGREWILRKSVGRAQIVFVWLRTGTCRALVIALTNPPDPYNARNFLTSWGTISISRKTLLSGISVKLALYVGCCLHNRDSEDCYCLRRDAVWFGIRFHTRRGIWSVQWQAWGRWRQRIPLKCMCLCPKPHSVMPHKTVFSRNWLWEWGIYVAIPIPAHGRTCPLNVVVVVVVRMADGGEIITAFQ
jgi:hypothetical protein